MLTQFDQPTPRAGTDDLVLLAGLSLADMEAVTCCRLTFGEVAVVVVGVSQQS